MDPRIEQALKLIDANYKDPIRLNRLIREVALSQSHFERLFKQEMGQPYRSYCKNFRLMRACEFLKERLRVSEVAYKVGYSDLSNFTRDFKRSFQETPSDYQRKFFYLAVHKKMITFT
jgi:AraC-like DNA-binding protein